MEMPYIEYDEYHWDNQIDHDHAYADFLWALTTEMQRRWPWYWGTEFCMVRRNDYHRMFRMRSYKGNEKWVAQFNRCDTRSFIWESLPSHSQLTYYKVELDGGHLGMPVTYGVYPSPHHSVTIYPAVWYVRDMKTNKFVTWKRIGNRDTAADISVTKNYTIPGVTRQNDPAYWEDVRDCELDIEDLFANDRKYQIELMDSGLVVDTVSYL